MNSREAEKIVSEITATEVTIAKVKALGGGCINTALKLETDSCENYLLKLNHISRLDMFEKEQIGLQLLANAETSLKIPETFGTGAQGNIAFLLMEYITPGNKDNLFWESLGFGLAEMHQKNTSPFFGLNTDNHIGETRQINSCENDWVSFFGNHRLRFQGDLATHNGYFTHQDIQNLERLIKKLGELIPANPEASLLHGDLWSGNIYCGEGGCPWLIDPAVYYGHRECEIAFTRMFGGFSPRFYSAYQEVWPLDNGYKQREDLYNLYHYLNHLNLFGRSYYGSVKQIILKYL